MLTDFDVEQGSSGAAAALTPGLLVPPVKLESSVSSSARARALTQSHCEVLVVQGNMTAAHPLGQRAGGREDRIPPRKMR